MMLTVNVKRQRDRGVVDWYKSKKYFIDVKKKIMMFLKYVNRDDADKKLKLMMKLMTMLMMMNLIKIFKGRGGYKTGTAPLSSF